MTASKKFLADRSLCKKIAQRYLMDDMPLLTDLAKEFSTTRHNVREAVRQELDAETVKKEQAKRYAAKKLGEQNPMTGRCREQHPNWKGQSEDGRGYYTMIPPDWWSGPEKRVFVHRVVAAEMLGMTWLPPVLSVHHVNEDPTDNRPENLLIGSHAAHQKQHSILRALRSSG